MMEHDQMGMESEEEVLISRMASNEARGAEWRRFEMLAGASPSAWERLARALRDELAARSAFDEVVVRAESLPLPAASDRGMRRLQLTQSWPGWALAAVLALAWAVSFLNPPRESGNTANFGGAIVPARHSADEAFHDYLTLGAQEGRVLQELPMMMVETRFDQNEGRIEVVYVRQLLERTTVQSAIELTEDPLGRPSAVEVDLTIPRPGKPL
jgi:hypothetical protein